MEKIVTLTFFPERKLIRDHKRYVFQGSFKFRPNYLRLGVLFLLQDYKNVICFRATLMLDNYKETWYQVLKICIVLSHELLNKLTLKNLGGQFDTPLLFFKNYTSLRVNKSMIFVWTLYHQTHLSLKFLKSLRRHVDFLCQY